jgi:hypothetical protein
MAMANQSERLEREIAATRERLAGTLDELWSRATFGHVVDEIVDNLPAGEVPDFGRRRFAIFEAIPFRSC